jgi:hypothetical protein
MGKPKLHWSRVATVEAMRGRFLCSHVTHLTRRGAKHCRGDATQAATQVTCEVCCRYLVPALIGRDKLADLPEIKDHRELTIGTPLIVFGMATKEGAGQGQWTRKSLSFPALFPYVARYTGYKSLATKWEVSPGDWEEPTHALIASKGIFLTAKMSPRLSDKLVGLEHVRRIPAEYTGLVR